MTKPLNEQCIDRLAELVAFDTTSSLSNLELISFIGDYLETRGIAHRLTFNTDKTKANLWATLGPVDRGGVVLSGHTDVVPVAGQHWSSNPFKLDHRNDRLYARGTADMKGFIACALAHTDEFLARDLKVPIHFAFSYDEEVGCLGVRELIQDVEANLPTPVAVIVGEPTSMKIIGGTKGGRSFKTTVTGVDGHSSLPDLGANAILAASNIIQHLVDVQENLKKQADPDNGFVPYYSTLDLGLISGGTATNIIPANCEFHWGFRSLPFQDMDALESGIRTFIADEVEPALKQISPTAGVTTELTSDVPPLCPDEQSSAEQVVRHISRLNASGRVSYATEAGHFQNAGIPGVIFGPGSIEQAHLPDEYIEVSQINACSDFLTRLADWAESQV
ncbi:MAG: acetylornithine deacetylase [Gammaproteobacteria bacterium]|nr:acetylornithine deacetylase [Gammaproteobacteria bacterium]